MPTSTAAGAARSHRISPLTFLLDLFGLRRFSGGAVPRAVTMAAVLALAAAMPAAAQHGWSTALRGGFATGLDDGSLEYGAWSVAGAVFRERGRTLAFGIEGGYDLFDARTDRLPGIWFFPAGGYTGSECPSPCTDAIRIDLTQRKRGSAWHVGPTARLRATTGALRPYALVGIGVYRIRDRTYYSAVTTDGGAPVSGLNRFSGSSFVAPGATGGVGLEYRPGGGRIGVVADTRFHVAGRPFDDYFGGAGYFVASGGITIGL